MPNLSHSSESSDHDVPDDAEHSGDPRNNAEESYDSMPGEIVDTEQNMPGDQPEQDTPPPLGAAKGTREK